MLLQAPISGEEEGQEAQIGEHWGAGVVFYLFYSGFNFIFLGGFFVILRFICKARDSTSNKAFFFLSFVLF